MLDPIKVKAKSPAGMLMKLAFPDYNGRKFKVYAKNGKMNLNSYWDGGSRNYFKILRLEDGSLMDVPQNGTIFDKMNFSNTSYPAVGYAVVEHTIFCGKDLGLRLYVHPDDMVPELTVC